MKAQVRCKIDGKTVVVKENAVITNNSSLQIELVKRLIECREIAGYKSSALAIFINKYLVKYNISDLEIVNEVKTLDARLMAA